MGVHPTWWFVCVIEIQPNSQYSSCFLDKPTWGTVVCVIDHPWSQHLNGVMGVYPSRSIVCLSGNHPRCYHLSRFEINLQCEYSFVWSIIMIYQLFPSYYVYNFIVMKCWFQRQLSKKISFNCFIDFQPSCSFICFNDNFPWFYHLFGVMDIHPLRSVVGFIECFPCLFQSFGFREFHPTQSVICFIDFWPSSDRSTGFVSNHPTSLIVFPTDSHRR